jgi:hypothetical protein
MCKKRFLVFLYLFTVNNTAHSQECSVSTINDYLQADAPANFGPPCVMDFPTVKYLCVPDGRVIKSTTIGNDINTNVMVTGRGVNILEDKKCARFFISVRTLNHTGYYPLYFCSPGHISVQISVNFCQ